jgi:hypothetical protein
MSDTTARAGSAGTPDGRVTGVDPYSLSAGLLWNDRFLLVPLCLVLALSALLDLSLQSSERSSWLLVVAVDRLLQISVVSYIVFRWRQRLQSFPGSVLSLPRLIFRIGVVSVASSILLAMPVLGLAVNAGGISSLFCVFLGVVGIAWCLRVYFYFAVAGILGTALTPGLAQAVRITKSDGMAAIRTLIVPCGVTMLLTALLTLPNPDGRSQAWMTVASSAEGVFWILSTYLALGYALIGFSEGDWRAAGLTPYRRERLATIQTQGGALLPKYLRPKFGLWLCLAGLFCMALNLSRQLNQPPATKVSVKSVNVADYSIKVELQVEDSVYKFRGFHPVAFSLKTKTGFTVSNSLTSASLVPDGKEFASAIVSHDGAPRSLYLTFSSGKTAAALKALDNVWLWYQFQPLVAIGPELIAEAPR